MNSKTIGLAATAGLLATGSLSAADKPNIIFILADDMGYSDLGCYGGEIDTPNLDFLAKNGIRFTNVHNTAKCFPSRASLLTGLYAYQCGMGKRPGSFKNSVSLGDVLRTAGYRTLASGKHHSTTNLFDMGFDRYYGLRDGACNFFNPGKQRPGEGIPAQKKPGKRAWCIDDKTLQPYTPPEKDFYTTDYFTKYAIDYLEKYKKEKKPFFLYLAYTAPHDPLQAWPKDIKKYENRYKKGWEALRKERYERMKKMGVVDKTMPLSEPSYKSWDKLSDAKKKEASRKMAVYAAMIDCMDQNIGKLLAKLKEIGKDKNTLIMFASDNGCSAETAKGKTASGEIGSMTRWTSLGGNWANASNTPFRYYKNYSYEGGICTPFIAYWPGVIKNKGSFSDFPGHFIDIMATIVDITGAKYPSKNPQGEKVHPYEGVSLLPVFKGEKVTRKKPIFNQWKSGNTVIHNGWKLVSNKGKWQLFDMTKWRPMS